MKFEFLMCRIRKGRIVFEHGHGAASETRIRIVKVGVFI